MDNESRDEFCVICNDTTPHSLVSDHNTDLVSTCIDCGHALKYPSDNTTPVDQDTAKYGIEE